MAKQYYCFLERFNNYFNRKIIRHESLEDYQNASKDFFIPEISDGKMMPFDFNPNDNITTEIIVNSVPFDPDYFLLLDEEAQIVSRWFVMEIKRNRQGQWLYFLRRDVLADSYEALSNAPLYVEKGVISDINSTLLLNNEELRVSQIKKEEILLKDKSECAWLVMYLKKGALGNGSIGTGGKVTINVPQNDTFVYLTLGTPITSWSFYQYTTTDYNVRQSNSIIVWHKDTSNSRSGHKYTLDSNGYREYVPVVDATRSNLFYVAVTISKLDNAFKPQFNTITSQLDTALGYKDLSALLIYNGKIIKDSNGKYYKCYIESTGNVVTNTYDISSDNAPTAKSTMASCWNTANESSQSPNDRAFQTKITSVAYRIRLEELTNVATTVDFSAYTGSGTEDSPLFDVIALPYGKVFISNPSEYLHGIYTDANRSMKIMSSIASQLSSDWVLDLQLLPYCPVQQLISPNYASPTFIFTTETHKTVLCGIDGGGDYTDAIFVCPSVSFTLDIQQSIKISDSSDVSDQFKLKYINDCTLIRLCSPNYNGLFDINLAKNGGNIDFFNVDITLRPYNPYIHVNPNFKFVYGKDFNDCRGLLCGGDFSLGIINDAWVQYEIQNKNYQNIFDRQIQNLDVNNAISMQESIWGAVAGTVQGAGAGGAGGGIATASPYGAIAGAVTGGLVSGFGGAMDIANLEKRQRETRDYAIDNFNFSLQNIKALPYSITKTSALTFNNKLFPFVEIYECSEIEKEAYYLKLKYNGMTVSKIDLIGNYQSQDNSNYFRARLIRIADISEDNHYIEVINEELMKGVFI